MTQRRPAEARSIVSCPTTPKLIRGARFRRYVRASALALAALGFVSACQPTVTRIYDGTAVQDRPIGSKAYAWYLKGRLLEQDGQLQAAEIAYTTTLTHDAKAFDAYIRLGAIRCQNQRKAADLAFERAESLAPNSVSLWQERASCALKTGKTGPAVLLATRALNLGPDDPKSSYLLIVAKVRNNELTVAKTLAWAHVSQHPRDAVAWELLSLLYTGQYQSALLAVAATRTHHTEESRSVGMRIGADGLPTHASSSRRERTDTLARANESLISALYYGDGNAVARAARALRLSTVRLSVRAYQLGAYEFAYEEALRASRIAPDNADAWALTLVLSELLGKTDTLLEVLARGVPIRPPQDPVVLTALEQMARRQESSTTPPRQSP